MHNYLEELNPAQRAAVEYIDGPSLIIAGAGSGKTRVLTYKIIYLIEKGFKSERILALTFTNKAAEEMKERIKQLIPASEVKKLWMGTFHSIFAKILRNEAEYLGYSKNYTIYDADDSKNEINLIIKELNLDTNVYQASKIHGIISNAKNNLYTAEAYANDPEIQKFNYIKKIPEVSQIFLQYQSRLKRANVMDFDDLLLNTNILFRDHPEILEKYRNLFDYILVDEYQDTNYAQYLIIKKLAQKHRKISVVGDDSQSIYAFRGARIENIFAFQRDFPEFKIFKLEQNYRSTKNIVNAANSVIENNSYKIPKKLFTANESGEKIQILEFTDDKQEAEFVAKKIKELKKSNNLNFRDFAVLYRANSQSRIFEQIMRKYNIPYKIFGGFSFYKRKEIKEIISYLKLALNPNDDQAILKIINVPKRGIGQTTLKKLYSISEENHIPIWQILEEIKILKNVFHSRTIQKLIDFRELIKDFISKKDQLNALEFTEYVYDKSGLKQHYLPDFSNQEMYDRYENLQEFINDVSQFIQENPQGKIEDFLENVVLQSSEDKISEAEEQYVSLMTVHSAKGLEFPVVFIVGTNDGLFPSTYSSFSDKEIEEERRLFYVAITRAKKLLFITYSTLRMVWGRYEYSESSRFIDEIDKKFVDFKSKSNRREDRFYEPQIDDGIDFYDKKEPQITQTINKEKLIKVGERPKEQETQKDFDPNSGLKKGMKVKHFKFGIGEILYIEGEGANTKVCVNFYKVGKKKLLLKFAKLEIVK